jgi:hypothetical protein
MKENKIENNKINFNQNFSIDQSTFEHFKACLNKKKEKKEIKIDEIRTLTYKAEQCENTQSLFEEF